MILSHKFNKNSRETGICLQTHPKYDERIWTGFRYVQLLCMLANIGCIGFATALLVIISLFTSFSPTLILASAEKTLTTKHEIQLEEHTNTCVYTVLVSVNDSITEKPVSDALVEFQTKSQDVITNNTNSDGMAEILLMLDKEPGKRCMEILLSQGYSVQASKAGYTGLGIGRVS